MYAWLSKDNFYFVTLIWIAIAIAVHIAMFFVTAPFGRHAHNRWGPMMGSKWGWIIMEAPSFLIMLYWMFQLENLFCFQGFLFIPWLAHYFNRSFVFPFRIRSKNKQIPIIIVFNAIVFNYINAGLNGFYLIYLQSTTYNMLLLVVGLFLFIIGAYINLKSDNHLISLRKHYETGYKIPHEFLFKYVSSPNLLGEIIEWGGYALMAMNPASASFFIWTCANLIPRAKNHHDWYHKNFVDYPKERKIIFPFVY